MKTIHHVLDIDAPPTTVWHALTEPAALTGWWSSLLETMPPAIGKLLHWTFADDFNPIMEITRLEPDHALEWRCVGGHANWADSRFRFELTPLPMPHTRLRFWQDYAVELADDVYGSYNFNWGYYLESLRLYCATGVGKPFVVGRSSDPTLIAKRLVSDVFNLGNMQAFDELFADDYRNHNMPIPGVPGTKAGFRQVVEATRRAFPDVQVHIDGLVGDGAVVVFRDSTTATSEGAFLGIPPTGKRLAWTEIHYLRIARGQILEHWNNFDQLGILRQLGAIPSDEA